MPNLTRTEASHRAGLIRVEGYRVALDLTRGADTFGSRTSIRFRADPGADSFLEIEPQVLHSATLNGVSLDPGTLAAGRLPLPDLAAHNELTLVASMAYTHNGTGLHRCVDPADGATYLYAVLSPDEAPRVFGCFDQPDLKAPFVFEVLADPQWTVVGNGVGRLVAPGHWTFAETPPLSTYLIGLAAGPYHAVHTRHDGIDLGLYARRSYAAELDREATEIFEVTQGCLDRYHQLFGIRYPFGKYDQVFVPEFTVGAMENPGIITFRDEFLFPSAVTEAEREQRAMVIAHEMAHMWFGDMVTMRWWDDLWLNESFAEYMGYRVTAEATRFREAWTGFTVGRKGWGYAADQRPSTHPVAADVPDTAAGLLNFDGISYAKGAAVLRQLVAWLGDEPFLAGVRRYFAAHAFGNATLADLLAALGAASGRDLTDWADLWLRTPGVNTLRLNAAPSPNGTRGTTEPPGTTESPDGTGTAVIQDGEPARPHRIGIGRYDRFGTRLDLVEVEIAGRVTPVRLAPAAMILLNDGDLSYAKVRLVDWAVLPTMLPCVADPLVRALLWGAAWEAIRDAELGPEFFVELAVAGLASETHLAVVADVLRCAEVTTDRFLPPEHRAAARDRLYQVCLAAVAAAGRGSGRQLAFARGLVRFAPAQAADGLLGWLSAAQTAQGVRVDAELRWAIWTRLAVLGAADPAQLAAEQARDRTVRGDEHAARARAARPDPAAKAAAWQAIVADERLNQRVLFAVAAGFWQPDQELLTAPYVDSYAAEMPGMAQRRNAQVVSRLAALAYPQFAVTQATLEVMAGLLGRGDLTPALRRSVVDATDELTRSLTVRARAHGGT
jgi:aminopeptidase N